MVITEKDIKICGHGSGTPSVKNLYTYNSSQYSRYATNGVRKGLVCVRRLKAMTDENRVKFHDAYKTILGRNIYNQNLRQYVYTKNPSNGRYYSDCSSSIMATYKKIGYNVTLLNTAGIYSSDLFETVPVRIEAGHIKNPEILKVADCLLYKGNDSKRPLQIGHVEAVYEIAGKIIPDDDKDKVVKQVKKYQEFLNTNYANEVKTMCGKLLVVDGTYGEDTRNASLAVWKYMSNKYCKTKLTINNKNFGSSCRKAAENFIVSYGYKEHPTIVWILQGILAGRGYYTGEICGTCGSSTNDAIKAFQKQKNIAVDGICGKATWYSLFNQ